eukprot:768646-Hanusia_phi.AAC.6
MENDFRMVSSPVHGRPRSRPSSLTHSAIRAKRPSSSKTPQGSTSHHARPDYETFTKALLDVLALDLGFEEEEEDSSSEAWRALEAGTRTNTRISLSPVAVIRVLEETDLVSRQLLPQRKGELAKEPEPRP